MFTSPKPADLFVVLTMGTAVGAVGLGLVGISVWMYFDQPWVNGLACWGGAGILLGYTGTLALIQHWSSPRSIPNLNMAETRIVAVVPDRTEGVIGSFPLPPGELRVLAGELLQPHVRFTEADYRSRWGHRKYREIRGELFRRGWAVPDYRGTPVLTVAGRNVLYLLANPPARPLRYVSTK